MFQTRRNFVKQAAAAVATTSFVRGTSRQESTIPAEHLFAWQHDTKRLSELAVDTAMRNGATYADIRLTLTRDETIWIGAPVLYACGIDDSFEHGIGVRVLADGAWGFAASSVWSAEEVTRLAREAILLAKRNAAGRLVRRNAVTAYLLPGAAK